MDKPVESKRAVTCTDLKPVERFLKRYETLTKDFSSRRPDAREQIIEEQIEEYKKKREKVLGGQSVVTFTTNETQKEVQEEEITNKLSFEKAEEKMTVPKGERREEEQEQKLEREQEKEEEDEEKEKKEEQEQEEQEAEEEEEEKEEEEEEEDSGEGEEEKNLGKSEKIDEGQKKANNNTEEYLSKLLRLKLKWEETKRKKESLQKELDESYSEGNLEKLAKVLGESVWGEKKLQVIEISLLLVFIFLFLLIYLVFLLLTHRNSSRLNYWRMRACVSFKLIMIPLSFSSNFFFILGISRIPEAA